MMKNKICQLKVKLRNKISRWRNQQDLAAEFTKLINVHMFIRNTMPRACATTATITMEDPTTPPSAFTRIGWPLLRACVSAATKNRNSRWKKKKPGSRPSKKKRNFWSKQNSEKTTKANQKMHQLKKSLQKPNEKVKFKVWNLYTFITFLMFFRFMQNNTFFIFLKQIKKFGRPKGLGYSEISIVSLNFLI